MKTKLPWIIVTIALMAVVYLLLFQPKPDSSTFERQAYIDSIKISGLNNNIEFLEKELDKKKIEYDTIEIIRIIYRDKFDTAAAKNMINNESVDSTCRKLLSDCVDLNEINELAITKLKAINTDNERLVNSLNEKVLIYEKQISLRDQQIEQIIKDNKKQLRKTKIMAGVVIAVVATIAILIK